MGSFIDLPRTGERRAYNVGSQLSSLAHKSASAMNTAASHVEAYMDGRDLPPASPTGTDTASRVDSSAPHNDSRGRILPLQEIVIDYESNNHSKRRSYRALSEPPRST